MIELMSIDDLLKINLDIPNYQRPYKWQNKSTIDLLNDIAVAIDEYEKYSDFKYRVGTIILHKNEESENKFDIIDGQQRLITLVLIKCYLDSSFDCSLLHHNFNSKIAQTNIHNNYECIRNWFSLRSNELKENFKKILSNGIEVVVLTVDKLTSAFQLFDSQNTRGKELDPHDLLKAYHLREMQNEPYEMFHAVSKWESFNPNSICNLFDVYLFSILNWAKREKTKTFTANEIDNYKGISESSSYTYAKRAKKADPYFQITEPFISGNDFFEMVAHYLILLNDINRELESNTKFENIKKIIDSDKSVGFKYAVDLFECAVLCYYDKFHNFDEQAIKKLFIWAFMLRIDMQNLGFDSINKYASGEWNDRYTNNIPMFSKIVYARYHNDIANLMIRVDSDNNEPADKKWSKLYKELRIMNGKED